MARFASTSIVGWLSTSCGVRGSLSKVLGKDSALAASPISAIKPPGKAPGGATAVVWWVLRSSRLGLVDLLY